MKSAIEGKQQKKKKTRRKKSSQLFCVCSSATVRQMNNDESYIVERLLDAGARIDDVDSFEDSDRCERRLLATPT
jgi:hypothetical protein